MVDTTMIKPSPINSVSNAGAMTPAVAQLRVTRDLHQAEAALDEALIRQANLLSTMVSARRATGLAPFEGQDALLRLLRSQQAMLDAGGELARVHGRLSTISVEKLGGNDECPKTAELADEALDDADAVPSPRHALPRAA